MQKSTYRLCAVGCCAAYILAFLFLPFIALKFVGIGLIGLHCLTINALSYFIIAFGIGMGICSFALPGKTAGMIDIAGAVLTLIMFFIYRGAVIGDGMGIAGTIVPGLSSAISGMGSAAISQLLTVGAGAVLPMIFAAVAGALCFLSENARKPAERTAGFGASSDDEW